MAYFNGFPATYQPYSQPQAQPSTQGINWIQGEQAAKSYLVAPNNTVVLFDSESQSIYIKSADASGMPSMKVLDYTVRDLNKAQSDMAYATKDELDALRSKVEMLIKEAGKSE